MFPGWNFWGWGRQLIQKTPVQVSQLCGKWCLHTHASVFLRICKTHARTDPPDFWGNQVPGNTLAVSVSMFNNAGQLRCLSARAVSLQHPMLTWDRCRQEVAS